MVECGSATMNGFVNDERQARRYFVSGMVQGVGFRYFTQDEAERLELSGYVRNLSDGRVEVYAIGSPGQLARLRLAVEQGPRGAMVSYFEEEPASIDSQYDGRFRITYES
jgi:acylphosphatase